MMTSRDDKQPDVDCAKLHPDDTDSGAHDSSVTSKSADDSLTAEESDGMANPAEKFVNLLESRDLVKPKMIASLRQLIGPSGSQGSAQSFANILTEEELLTESDANDLLEEAQQSATGHVPQASSPDSSIGQSTPPTGLADDLDLNPLDNDPHAASAPLKREPESESEPEPYPEPKQVPLGELENIWKASVDEALAAIKECEPEWEAEKAQYEEEEKEREKERAEKEQAEKEQAEKEQAEKEQAEKEQAEKEQAEKEQAEKEQAEKEQAEKEQADEEPLALDADDSDSIGTKSEEEEKELAAEKEKEEKLAKKRPRMVARITRSITSMLGGEPKVGTPHEKLRELVAFYQDARKSDNKIDEEEEQLKPLIMKFKKSYNAYRKKHSNGCQLETELKTIVWGDEPPRGLDREEADDLLKRIDLLPIEPAINEAETGSEPELVNLERLYYKWYKGRDKISLRKDYENRCREYLQTHPGHEEKLGQMEDKVKKHLYTPPPVSEMETEETETESEAVTAGLKPAGDTTEASPTSRLVPPLSLESPNGERIDIKIKTTVGKSIVKQFGEDAQFWSEPQFSLEKVGDGWVVTHDSNAKNETLLNGKTVTGSQPVNDGDKLAVGIESKGIIKLPLEVRIGTP